MRGGSSAASTDATPAAAGRAQLHAEVLIPLACLAIALPALMAFNEPPSATFLNQAAALVGWGLMAAYAIWVLPATAVRRLDSGAHALLAASGFLALAAAASPFWSGLPWGLAVSSVGVICAAALVFVVGVWAQSSGRGDQVFRAFCVALLVAGSASLILALIQQFVPAWADGVWIASVSSAGRVVGNLRQSNHLSSLLLWAIVALIWLYDEGGPAVGLQQRLRQVGVVAMLTLLLFGVVLTVSRTGTVCVVMLALWGVADRKLSRFARVLVWLAPLIYVMWWLVMAQWAQSGSQVFAGAEQLNKADLSSSRFGIWKNTLALVAQHPWWGVGWGEFNFAWTLTPFPGRPVAFFDHTHNLPLQLLVELGLPLGTMVLALMGWALLRGVTACRGTPALTSRTSRCAFLMVLMMTVHSQLEYPLWYAYFLLPTAFAMGLCLGCSDKPSGTENIPKTLWLKRGLMLAAISLTIGAVASVVDYRRVVVIFSPSDDAEPLSVRIANGQRSWFFAHHADYAFVTTVEHPPIQAFSRAPHYLLDTRLMIAWARALNESGARDKASYIAQRLKEFHNEQSLGFFAECEGKPASAQLPFQCVAPSVNLDYRDFHR